MLVRWTLQAVDSVVREERDVVGLDRRPYAVGDHAWTGGPVLRGPWGSIGGSQSQFAEYERRCKDLIAAYIHGHVRANRDRCEEVGSCLDVEQAGYCRRCGAKPDDA